MTDIPFTDAVWCHECDNVHEQTRKEPPFKWLCRAHPRPTQPSFTIPGAIIGTPFERCERINFDGCCEDFTPRRQP